MGLLDDASARVGAAFAEGSVVLLLGASLDADASSLGGSEHLAVEYGMVAGAPRIDLDAEARLQWLLVELARARLLRSAHDCSDGGLATALVESALWGGAGFSGDGDWSSGRWDALLFGEAPSRAVVSCAEADVEAVSATASSAGVPAVRLGVTGGRRLALPRLADEPLDALADAYEGGLERALGR